MHLPTGFWGCTYLCLLLGTRRDIGERPRRLKLHARCVVALQELDKQGHGAYGSGKRERDSQHFQTRPQDSDARTLWLSVLDCALL